jgi:protease-4
MFDPAEEHVDRLRAIGRLLLVLAGGGLGAALGWLAVVEAGGGPTAAIGLAAAAVLAVFGARAAGSLAETLLVPYQVAEVAVTGPITRGSAGFTAPVTADADAVVEQIERADADRGADGLLVRLNTPGGAVVPSDDIRRAVDAFDGPTVAYATDTCASGGYWIASGCDEIWARDASLVGSIGVLASRLNASDLADRLGIDYERVVAGEFKDAGSPLKEPDPDDREYLQGLADAIYERFLDRVDAGRDLDRDDARDTEARVFLGDEAADRGLIDGVGDRDDAENALAERLDRESVTVREFEPSLGLRDRLGASARGLAHAFGAGLASGIESDGPDLRV